MTFKFFQSLALVRVGLWLILLLTLCFNYNSCTSQKLPVQEIVIQRDGQLIAVVKAEIADTQETRQKGLMFRTNLPDGQGMFFVFENDQVLSFWMKNTYIPLSIAYITFDGRIVDIIDMFPRNETPVFSSRSVRYALEVPQNWFSRAGVRTGDIVIINK
ncbi:MAG: DUF192 domain-containing protein [Treponema sp.]|jgi:uncharacterized membrane protein (UPF0127 family)|nr:DUF192 domain-containing protein [Treponema sp.]